MDIVLVPLLFLLKSLFSLLSFVLIADIILSFLMAANVINTSNQIVHSVMDSIRRISDWMCDPVRRNLPVLVGALDFSPVVVIMVLTFLEHVVARILMKIG